MLAALYHLFTGFFKIGLFTIGGGYAMLPLMQEEIARYGWITPAEFIDIIAIAEMTPGAIAVNTATFAGFRTAGIIGAIVATAALALPSLLIIVPLSNFWEVHREHPILKAVFNGIKPAVAGLTELPPSISAEPPCCMIPCSKGDGFPVDLRSLIIAAGIFWCASFGLILLRPLLCQASWV